LRVREKEAHLLVYETILLLWKERFFFKPKSFEQIYKEITRPSKTSADIPYEKQTLNTALQKLVEKGILVRKGSMLNESFSQRKEPRRVKTV
jgi:hypothetical protein